MHVRLFSVISILCYLIFPLWAKEVYVSPDGPQNGDGSSNAPFPTIEKARDYVRTQIPSMNEDITVVLRQGSKPFFLNQTVLFTEQDGGKNGHKVIYRNHIGERPVVSGGIVISNWQKISGTSPEKWKATLDHPKKIRYLFVDYIPGYRARGEKKIRRGNDWGDYGGFPSGFHTDNISLSNAHDVELYMRSSWGDHQFCVDRIENNSIVVMQQPYWVIGKDHAHGWHTTSEFIVENAPEHVNKPGEFSFDRTAKTIYYVPRSGQDMNTATVIANSVEVLFKVKGSSPDAKVHNLEFHGIAFHNADYELVEIEDSHGYTTTQTSVGFANYVKGGQSAKDYWAGHLHIQAAVQLFHAQEVHVVGCRFEYCGGSGVDAWNDVHNSSIVGNVFHWIGGTSIYVGDIEHGNRDFIFPQELYPCPPEPRYWVPCKNVVVSNNLIRKTTWDFTHSPAIQVAFTEACELSHNDIGPCGFNHISMGLGWLNRGDGNLDPSGTAKNNRIRANRCNAACLHRDDCGHIYTLGHQPGTLVDSNYCFFEGQTVVANRSSMDWDPVKLGNTFDLAGWGSLYPDADSYGITYRDNVYKGGKCLLHTWWTGTEIRKNILDGGWYSSNSGGICSKALRIEKDAQSYDPGNPPAECKKLIDNAGLESNWRYLLEDLDWKTGMPVQSYRTSSPADAQLHQASVQVVGFNGLLPQIRIPVTRGEHIRVSIVNAQGRQIVSHRITAERSGFRKLLPRDYAAGFIPARGVYLVHVVTPSTNGTIRTVAGR